MDVTLERPDAVARDAGECLKATSLAVRPPPPMTISQWAEGRIVIPGESGTSSPGPLSWDGLEFIREPLDRLHPDDPTRDVIFVGSAQIAKTTIGIVATAYYSAEAPRAWAVALPTGDEVKKYNRTKWQPIVDATPELRRKIRPVLSRDEQGSTTTYKRFPGGYGQLISAGAASALQMISLCLIVMEETPNWEADVEGRGDPIAQLRARQTWWELAGAKTFHNSTPGTKGQCPVTKAFEGGDQRRLYHPCPHCGDRDDGVHLRLDWARMRGLEEGDPYFVCPGCSGRIEHRHKPEMVRRSVWLPTFPSAQADNPAPDWFVASAEVASWRARDCELRPPSYHAWQVVSPAVDWRIIAQKWRAAETAADEAARRTFSQQCLGEASELTETVADIEVLLEKREPGIENVVPEGAYLLFGAVDFNGDFAKWRVWGFGPGLECWPIAGGLIEGGPNDPALWRELREIVSRAYQHKLGGRVPVESWLFDSGYGTANVYAFCRSYVHVKAGDGRAGWGLLPLKRGAKNSVRGPDGVLVSARIWEVGTWDLKRTLYECLAVTAEADKGAGIPLKLHIPDWIVRPQGVDKLDKTFLEELTAEIIDAKVNPKTGEVSAERWKRIRRRNEEMDLFVYCAAQAKAKGVGVPGSEPDWLALGARIGIGNGDLEEFWERPTPPPAPPAVDDPSTDEPAGESLAELYRRTRLRRT